MRRSGHDGRRRVGLGLPVVHGRGRGRPRGRMRRAWLSTWPVAWVHDPIQRTMGARHPPHRRWALGTPHGTPPGSPRCHATGRGARLALWGPVRPRRGGQPHARPLDPRCRVPVAPRGPRTLPRIGLRAPRARARLAPRLRGAAQLKVLVVVVISVGVEQRRLTRRAGAVARTEELPASEAKRWAAWVAGATRATSARLLASSVHCRVCDMCTAEPGQCAHLKLLGRMRAARGAGAASAGGSS